MDSSKHRNASELPLDRLVARALNELEQLGYSRRSLRRYRTVWAHLVRFAREMNLADEYSEDLAERFVDAHRRRSGKRTELNEEWRRHIRRDLETSGASGHEEMAERVRAVRP